MTLYHDINKPIENGKSPQDLLNEYGCLHFLRYGIGNVSVNPYDPEQLAKLKAEDERIREYNGKSGNGYYWTQEQRKIETAIREAKGQTVIAKASGDDVLLKSSQAKVKALTAEYNKMSEAVGVQKTVEIMSVSGYMMKGRKK